MKSTPVRLLAAALCLGLAATAGCSRTQTASARGDAGSPIAIRAFEVKEETVRRRVQATGSLFALEESTISAEVEGPVAEVLVDVGDSVQQGQPLVRISETEFRFEVERQKGIVAQVRAQLGIGPADPLPANPSQVAFVQRAAADLFDAQQKYQRAEQLFRDKLISQQQLDEASSKYKGASAAHDLALQDVDRLKGQIHSSETAERLAEKKLADCTIKAPYPGAIKERRVHPGEYMRVQGPVMVVVRTDTLRARLAVPEKWAGAVKTGATIDLQVEAYPGQTFQGRLERINPSVAQDSRTFDVEALVPNAAGKLKPGFFVQASLPSEVEEKALFVPDRAVTYRYGTYKVYVLNGSRVAERPIRPGAPQADRMEILEGLKAGERIAVAVRGELRDGAVVQEEAAAPKQP